MFGCQPCLPIDFYFPRIRDMKHQHADHYIAELHEQLWEAFKEAQVQSTSEAERQKQYYDRKAYAISLEPGDLVLAKVDAYRGKKKLKGWWEEELYEVVHQVAEGIPSYLMKNQRTGCFWVLWWNWLYLIAPTEGTPLCMAIWAKQARCTTTTLEVQTPEGSETEEAPQSANCLSPARCQTGKTPVGWVNRKPDAFLLTFSGAFLLDQKWKVQCREIRDMWKSTSVFWWCRYWSHWWGSNETTDHDNFNPTSLHSRDCKLITIGVWNGGTRPCMHFWGNYFILNTDGVRNPGIPHARDVYWSNPLNG